MLRDCWGMARWYYDHTGLWENLNCKNIFDVAIVVVSYKCVNDRIFLCILSVYLCIIHDHRFKMQHFDILYFLKLKINYK